MFGKAWIYTASKQYKQHPISSFVTSRLRGLGKNGSVCVGFKVGLVAYITFTKGISKEIHTCRLYTKFSLRELFAVNHPLPEKSVKIHWGERRAIENVMDNTL